MWVELQNLQVGDLFEVRGQSLVLTKAVKEGNNRLVVKGTTDDGRQVIYVGLPDEMVKRAKQVKLHYLGVA